MDVLLKGSILMHVLGSLVIIIGLPIAANTHLSAGMIWTKFQPGNWGASYGHGVTSSPYSSIFSGYLANDNMNYGGNGLSVTSSDFASGLRNSTYGMIEDSSSTASTSSQPWFGSGRGFHPINCDDQPLGHGNTGCIVRATHHQNWLGLTNKGQGTPSSAANPYIFFCGMLMAQWSFTGYDASVHMVEETSDAQHSGPHGLFRALTINAAFGFAFIISIISSVQDYRNSFFGPLALNYNPVAQIFFDVFEERTGNGRNGCGFWAIIMCCMFLCGVSCITSNARMLYAFARDGAVPGHNLWHRVSEATQIPVNAVWFMTIASIAIAVPVCYSSTAYAAVTSITTIGLYSAHPVAEARLRGGGGSLRHTALTLPRSFVCHPHLLPRLQPQGLRARPLLPG